jgi:hypothetical protein
MAKRLAELDINVDVVEQAQAAPTPPVNLQARVLADCGRPAGDDPPRHRDGGVTVLTWLLDQRQRAVDIGP